MSTAFQGDEDVVVTESTGHLQVQLSLHVRLGACPEQVELEVAD